RSHLHAPLSHSCPTRRSSDLLAAGFDGRWRSVVGTAPQHELFLAELLQRLLLVLALQGTVVTLVEPPVAPDVDPMAVGDVEGDRSEEHTSELQSRENLVCRLL